MARGFPDEHRLHHGNRFPLIHDRFNVLYHIRFLGSYNTFYTIDLVNSQEHFCYKLSPLVGPLQKLESFRQFCTYSPLLVAQALLPVRCIFQATQPGEGAPLGGAVPPAKNEKSQT